MFLIFFQKRKKRFCIF